MFAGLLIAAAAALAAEPAPVYPDAAFSVSAEDHWINFQTMAGVGSYPLGADRAAKFEYNERLLEPPSGGPGSATVWRFRCKPGTSAGTVLALDERIRFLPQAIRLSLLNRSEQPIRLALELQEMPWEPTVENRARSWHMDAPNEVARGQETTLTYNLAQAKPNRTRPDRPPLPPFIAVTILPENIEKDTSYEIVFESVAVKYYDSEPDTYGFSAPEHIALNTDEEFIRRTNLGVSMRGGFDREPVGASVGFNLKHLPGWPSEAGVVETVPREMRECAVELAMVEPQGRYEPVMWRVLFDPIMFQAPSATDGGFRVGAILPPWLPDGQYRVRLVQGARRLAECRTEITNAQDPKPCPPPADPDTCGLSAPDRIIAGMNAELQIERLPDLMGEYGIQFMRVDSEGRCTPVLWQFKYSPREIKSRSLRYHDNAQHVEAPLPAWMQNGHYIVRLMRDSHELSRCSTEVAGGKPAQPSFACAGRGMWKDCPAVFLEKQPFCWDGYSSYEYQPGNVTEFGHSGVNLMCIPVDAARHVHHHAALPVLIAPDTYDYGQLEERVAFSLQANPDARLFLRVSLAPPLFWLQAHPEARALIRTEQGDLPHEETVAPQVSHASKQWLEDEANWLRALLEYCRKQPWGNRLMGVWLTSGVTEEWFAWGSNDGLWSDYSPEMREAFRTWQQSRGWEPRDMPDPAVRDRNDCDIYPDDGDGRLAAAYARFASEHTADTIAHFARVVKEVSDRQLLVGVFYGYLFQLAGEPRQSTGNHYALRGLLDNPDVDLFSGIPLLNYRTLRDGFDAWVVPNESLRAAGKLYCNENDLFSWLHPILWHTEYDPADPRGGAITMHRRVFANDIIHGGLRQWFSLMSSWHHDEKLQMEFARLISLNCQLQYCDRTPVEQVAFVVDDTSFAWIPPASKLGALTVPELYKQCSRTGAPVGAWMLSDLEKLPDRVRFVVVTQAHAPTKADLEKLQSLIEKGGRAILLVGPVGLVNPNTQTWDRGATARLTGLPVVIDSAPSPGKTLWCDSGALNHDWGTVSPRARLDGGPAPLLRYADDAAAAAERDLPNGGRLIWCGMPPDSPEVLRGWMQRAGVRCCAPVGCVVQACKDLVSVTADAPGDVTLCWPEPVRVQDVFDDWTGEGKDIICPFAAGQTRLFKVDKASPSLE